MDIEDKHGLVRHMSLMKSFFFQVWESCFPDPRAGVASTSPRG